MKKNNSYAGGKIGSGSFQQIINEIPKCINRMIVPFLGNCPIARYFYNRLETIGYEVNTKTVNDFWSREAKSDYPGSVVINNHHPLITSSHKWLQDSETFIYADPPYLFSTRRGGKIYKHEMGTEKEHTQLLQTLLTATSYVAISGYDSGLYNEMLEGWRKKSWTVGTRNGKATECLWMNYSEPLELYTYDFLGTNNAERQRIKRKIDRHVQRLKYLPRHEAMSIVDAINHQLRNVTTKI